VVASVRKITASGESREIYGDLVDEIEREPNVRNEELSLYTEHVLAESE
jgi:hypothetical protein